MTCESVESVLRRVEEAINPLLRLGSRPEKPRCEMCGEEVDPIGRFTVTLAHAYSLSDRKISFFCCWGCFVRWATATVAGGK